MGRTVLVRFADQLGQHVDPRVQQIPHYMSVVTAHVTLLREWTIEKTARLEIKFSYTNVRRQPYTFQRFHIVQFGIAVEDSLRQWFQEAALEFVKMCRSIFGSSLARRKNSLTKWFAFPSPNGVPSAMRGPTLRSVSSTHDSTFS
jgi:hypothetical protein